MEQERNKCKDCIYSSCSGWFNNNNTPNNCCYALLMKSTRIVDNEYTGDYHHESISTDLRKSLNQSTIEWITPFTISGDNDKNYAYLDRSINVDGLCPLFKKDNESRNYNIGCFVTICIFLIVFILLFIFCPN